MRIVPVLFPCDLGHNNPDGSTAGGERGAPDVLLDQLEGEGVRLAAPVTLSIPPPTPPDGTDFVDPALPSAVEALAESVAGINGNADFPLILGGDHTGLLGQVLGHSRRHADGIGLAVLADACLDLKPWPPDRGGKEPPEVARSVLSAALRRFPADSALGAALAESTLQASQLSVAGVRAPRSARARVREEEGATGVDVWTMERIELDGESAYRSVLNQHLARGPIVLSVDVCGVDPHLMPAVRTAFPDGLDWSFLKRSLEQCVPHVDRILGLDICGLDPSRDDAYKSAASRLAETLAPFLQKLRR
jgi:arginase family enzyme